MSERNEDGRESAITWNGPPADEAVRWSRPVKYAAEAEEMRQRPGEWALFKDTPTWTRRSAYNLADNIRRGRLVAFSPAGSFEAIARQKAVWARYVGEGGQ